MATCRLYLIGRYEDYFRQKRSFLRENLLALSTECTYNKAQQLRHECHQNDSYQGSHIKENKNPFYPDLLQNSMGPALG